MMKQLALAAFAAALGATVATAAPITSTGCPTWCAAPPATARSLAALYLAVSRPTRSAA